MITNPLNINATSTSTTQLNTLKTNTESSQTPISTTTQSTTVVPQDTLEIGQSKGEDFGTYKVDKQKLNQIMQEFNKKTNSFREMVRTMLEKQGKNVNDVLKAIDSGEEVEITIDSETKETAKAAISEDGYWGVNQTSARLLDYAKTISGGDKSKIETLKTAFVDGYAQAKEAFGGKLPEISQQTYDKVMEGFDQWQNE